MKQRLSGVLAICFLLSGCGYLAVKFAPEKTASTDRTEAATKADEFFWATLHGGHYEKIPQLLTALTAAYLDAPSDATTAAHIGFVHSWALAERARSGIAPSTVVDHAVLARKYFAESYRLKQDPRVLGFLGGLTVAEGSIHKDEKLVRKGYYTLLDSIEAWPEFNYFTAGYGASRLPADSKRFREAIEFQWRNLDVCVNERVDRQNPEFSRYMQLATTEGPKRVCWNSWIAPHNFEGFFLNFGDMLVKAGEWQLAQKVYANAKLSPDYARWGFREVLEQRIDRAQANVADFNVQPVRGTRLANPIMTNSSFACMACHQKSGSSSASR